MIWNLMLMTAVVVYVIDLSGFVYEMKRKVYGWVFPRKAFTDFSIKPFDCSTCATWWGGLAVILMAGEFTLVNVFIVAMLSFFAEQVGHILLMVKDFIGWLTNRATETMWKQK